MCIKLGTLIRITGLVFYVKIEDVTSILLYVHKTVKKTFSKIKSTPQLNMMEHN